MPKSSEPLSLNSEQQEAVAVRGGAFAVVAGAGSGKTSLLVARYAALRQIAEAEDILNLTFTKEAAANMRKRADDKSDGQGKPHGFVTFHSLALSIATREHGQFPFQLQPFPLATEGQANKFLAEAARKFKADFRILRSWVSLQKRGAVRPSSALKEAEAAGKGYELAFGYKDYDDRLKKAGILDFDSLLLESVELLKNRSDIRSRYQYRFIQIDEAQDTDPLQLELVKLLSEEHGNVFWVGDENQAIYGWRGADSGVLLNLSDHFPNAKTLYLRTNYRATQELTNFNYKIAPFPPPEPYITPNELGVPPVVRVYLSAYDEAAGAVSQIPSAPQTSAILARTNRALRPFEEKLSEEGVRYHLLGKSGFWQQREIKDVLAYVQLVVSPFDAAVLAALRSPFHPSKYIRKKEIAQYVKERQGVLPKPSAWAILRTYSGTDVNQASAISGFLRFVQSLSVFHDVPASRAVAGVVSQLKALDYFVEEEEAVDNNPIENLQELSRIAGRFGTLPEFLEHVRRIQGASRVKKGVALGTCHAAKGREFDVVFLVNCQEGVLPHAKGDVEEEKRVFFTGASRAAKRLFISYSGAPSRFLAPFIETQKTGG